MGISCSICPTQTDIHLRVSVELRLSVESFLLPGSRVPLLLFFIFHSLDTYIFITDMMIFMNVLFKYAYIYFHKV